jgi:hypothetical protein
MVSPSRSVTRRTPQSHASRSSVVAVSFGPSSISARPGSPSVITARSACTIISGRAAMIRSGSAYVRATCSRPSNRLAAPLKSGSSTSSGSSFAAVSAARSIVAMASVGPRTVSVQVPSSSVVIQTPRRRSCAFARSGSTLRFTVQYPATIRSRCAAVPCMATTTSAASLLALATRVIARTFEYES